MSEFGHKNNYYTQQLFYELNGYNSADAMYTTMDEDKEVNGKLLPSARRLYVEMEDVHEYEYATTYFGGWRHWQKLCDSPKVGPHIKEWRKELEVKLRTRNLKRMEALAEQGDRQAIKYMADKGWADSDKPKRGRPSKEEVAGERKRAAAEAKETEHDWNRINAH